MMESGLDFDRIVKLSFIRFTSPPAQNARLSPVPMITLQESSSRQA